MVDERPRPNRGTWLSTGIGSESFDGLLIDSQSRAGMGIGVAGVTQTLRLIINVNTINARRMRVEQFGVVLAGSNHEDTLRLKVSGQPTVQPQRPSSSPSPRHPHLLRNLFVDVAVVARHQPPR